MQRRDGESWTFPDINTANTVYHWIQPLSRSLVGSNFEISDLVRLQTIVSTLSGPREVKSLVTNWKCMIDAQHHIAFEQF